MVPLIGLAIGAALLQPADVPKLDVPAAIRALETQQVHQAPGAVANIDLDVVRREMAPDTKLLIAPFERGYKDDEHYEQVSVPLKKWADAKKVRLITVEGLYTRWGPSNLTELRQQTAYMDITGPALASVREINRVPVGQAYPAYQVLAPTSAQVADLAGKLRQNPVHNAPDRADKFTLSPRTIQEKTGFTIRVAALPALRPGEPFVDYAPALAAQFPDDIVLVAQGYWVEVAGKDKERVDSARNYAFGRYEIGTFSKGGTIDGRVATIITRLDELSRSKPFGRPQPETYDPARTIARYTPLAWGGSAVVLGGGALAGFALRRKRRQQAADAALLKAKAKAYARISELGAALTEQAPTAAAERYTTARDLFEQAHTAEAMAEVERIADEGLAAL
ncbi:hypothetical protein [Kibdelosporangium phytohabitans]|uniref:DUF4350 domain-containing protein n=1 Tax=Kibdelosporangium phytohabitans TaxID=860235 RepID=A0A0N9IBT7_9PSEU|nr:hypothetical protein [Kibdelosporangium phytohabitans]ALG13725.1 hypothetical protein AOZ06_48805 [Kibdelosporangium phytohabitans]MBE1465616.1 hypothetical protein [Kibdelosporangium phytohabitans]